MLTAVDVGLALPQMTSGLDRTRVRAWCAAIDDGPFSSVSAGERITFDNLDGFTLCAAAAGLTDRVRVLLNVVVAPWHQPAMLAKQVASIDVVSGGRVELAVGVGGREQDYAALGSPFAGRFGRLDDARGRGPPALGRWRGRRRRRRRARPGAARRPSASCAAPWDRSPWPGRRAWADGVSGFAIDGDPAGVDARLPAGRAGVARRRSDRAAPADDGRVRRPRPRRAPTRSGPSAPATSAGWARTSPPRWPPACRCTTRRRSRRSSPRWRRPAATSWCSCPPTTTQRIQVRALRLGGRQTTPAGGRCRDGRSSCGPA